MAVEDVVVLVMDRDDCDRRLAFPEVRALVANLEGYGFRRVTHVFLERLPWHEQLRTVAGSHLLVAAHGGGEGWAAVMARGGVLVELRLADSSGCFKPYAKWVGVHRLPVDALPPLRNASCFHSEPWRNIGFHIVPEWAAIKPAVDEAVRLLASGEVPDTPSRPPQLPR